MMMRLIYFFSILFISTQSAALQTEDPAPKCDAKMLQSTRPLDLENYRNKVLLIDFWATWCAPCKQSMPFLNALRNDLFDQGFEIIAINVDEDLEDAKKFLQSYPVDYVMASDVQGDCPQKYEVKAMPSSYFVDRKGVIRYIHLGFRRADEEEIRARVLKLLQEKN